jgi:hypothetical protein
VVQTAPALRKKSKLYGEMIFAWCGLLGGHVFLFRVIGEAHTSRVPQGRSRITGFMDLSEYAAGEKRRDARPSILAAITGVRLDCDALSVSESRSEVAFILVRGTCRWAASCVYPIIEKPLQPARRSEQLLFGDPANTDAQVIVPETL